MFLMQPIANEEFNPWFVSSKAIEFLTRRSRADLHPFFPASVDNASETAPSLKPLHFELRENLRPNNADLSQLEGKTLNQIIEFARRKACCERREICMSYRQSFIKNGRRGNHLLLIFDKTSNTSRLIKSSIFSNAGSEDFLWHISSDKESIKHLEEYFGYAFLFHFDLNNLTIHESTIFSKRKSPYYIPMDRDYDADYLTTEGKER